MAHFHKYKDVEIKLPDVSSTFAGEMRMETFKGIEFPRGSGRIFEFAGTRREVLPWRHNIILLQGLDFYSNGGYTNMAESCIVGTSSQVETETDSGCIAPVASTYQVYNSPPSDAQNTPPYFGWTEYKYRFNPGFGGGNINISECAFVCAPYNAGTLAERNATATSRALTRDSQGDPTTITVLADEYLDVYYRRRQYPGYLNADGTPNDGTGTIDISGTSYGYTIRPAVVTSSSWAAAMGNFRFTNGGFGASYASAVGYGSDATLGTVLQNVQATESETHYYTYDRGYSTYVNGTYNQDCWVQYPLDRVNFSGGLKGHMMITTRGGYQVVFDAAIPKDNTKIFTYYENFSWAGKTI